MERGVNLGREILIGGKQVQTSMKYHLDAQIMAGYPMVGANYSFLLTWLFTAIALNIEYCIEQGL